MQSNNDAMQVDRWTHWAGGVAERFRDRWIALGNLETRLFCDDINGITIDRPVYVGGLARAGSTILLEVLARHPAAVTHQYCDYPFLFTPVFWGRFLTRAAKPAPRAVERAHRDGIMVTPQSPEAVEEMLWMAFFESLHDPAVINALDAGVSQPDFERFYRDHLRKLLWLRHGERYIAKGNYNSTRFDYLLKLFPDARFILPIRAPVGHIASLMKQHRLLGEGERIHPRALAYMRRIGHFEFGLDRRPVNAGDDPTIAAILDCWQRGAEVEGWARYWSHIYGFVADRLDANEGLLNATRVVRFEDLCEAPRATLAAMFAHCELEQSQDVIRQAATAIRYPGYYEPTFRAADLDLIERFTRATAARFGY